MKKERDKQYWGPTLFGAPIFHNDRERAANQLLQRLTVGQSILAACADLNSCNERVVGRCSVLIQFNSITIGIFLFIAANPKLITWSWQKVGFYLIMFGWVITTMLLVYSLRYIWPAIEEIAEKGDAILTARLYLQRVFIYNSCLLYSLISFGAAAIFLLPFSANVVDVLFSNN